MLRRWRRTILLASFPAMLASALSAGTCIAMPATRTPAHATHIPAAAETAHHHHASRADTRAAPELPTPCPHCPFDSGAANTATFDCAPTDARDGAPPPSAEPAASPPTSHSSTAAHAIAPLIRAAPARASPLPAHVPLNLRYCVLLI